MMKKMIILVLGLMAACTLHAQRFTLGTNIADYVDYGTLNLSGTLAVGKRWSLGTEVKYNPYLFSREGRPRSARQRLFSLGSRYWPWHVYSGWWLGAKMQYQEYNRGGIRSELTEEGDRFGAGLSGGYSYMLLPHLNLDIGIGFWGGWSRYTAYACPVCGLTLEQGSKVFFLPNDILFAFSYVF